MAKSGLPSARTRGRKAIKEIDILWITAGLGCDGDTISITAATQPSLEDLIQGVIPGIPKVTFHNPVLAYPVGEPFLAPFHRAEEGKLGPFILVVEGSIPDEKLAGEGCWAAMGTDEKTGQPRTTCSWIDRLARHAWAVVAAGTCAAYGGIHAMEGNPTGAMGLPDYLGWKWKSKAGIQMVCVPGCPVQPDNFMGTLLNLLRHAAGTGPMIPLDDQLRPTELFGATTHEGCGRGGRFEQAEFTERHGHSECIVKLGCWGPVVQCNVGKRGWINGIGGCPSVGGICIGCTMPGFPDKFLSLGKDGSRSLMNEPSGVGIATRSIEPHGEMVRMLRRYKQVFLNTEPERLDPRAAARKSGKA